MIELISAGLLARLKELASIEDPLEIIRFAELRVSNFDAASLLEGVCLLAMLKWADQNGRLSLELVRQLMSTSSIETIDLTGVLPSRDDVDTIPLGESNEG